MPRSVIVGVVCLSLVGLLGLVGTAMAVADVATNGIWSHGELAAGLHVPERAISLLIISVFPFFVAGALRGVTRRDSKARSYVVGLGLALSIGLGVILGIFLIVFALQRDGLGAVVATAAMGVFVAPFAITSYALSRRSAKAWFASARARP